MAQQPQGPQYEDDPYGVAQAAPQGGPQYEDDPYSTGMQSGISADGPTYDENPYDAPAAPETATGIAQLTASNRADNTTKLQALHDSPTTTPAQKERLKRLIDKMHDPRFYNTITEDRVFGSNFVRGALTGLVNEGALGTVDFASAVAQLGAEGADALFNSHAEAAIEAWRSRIAEAQQITKDTFDAQGISGTAGRVAGALGSTLAGGTERKAIEGFTGAFKGGLYGAVAHGATEILAKVPGSIGRAAKLGLEGNWLQRAAINVLAGLPIDAIQALTIPESDAVKVAQGKQENGVELTPEDQDALDEHWAEQLRTLGLGLVASGAGGALIEGGAKLLGAAGNTAMKIKAGSPRGPNGETELASQADALLALGDIAKQRTAARRAANRAWSSGNIEMRTKLLAGLTPDQYASPFKELPPDIQQSLLEAFGGPKIGPIPPDVLLPARPAGTPSSPPSGPSSPTPSAAGAPAAAEQVPNSTVAVMKRVKELGLEDAVRAEAIQRTGSAADTELAARTVLKNYFDRAALGSSVAPTAALPSESMPAVSAMAEAQKLVGRKRFASEVANVLKKRTTPPTNPEAMGAIVEAVARQIVDRHAGKVARQTAILAGGEVAGVGAKAAKAAPVEAGVAAPAEREVSVVDKLITEAEQAVKSPREAELERRLADAERQATVDDLTGMQNKNAWLKARPRIDSDHSVEVVSFDVGNLKATNDHLGSDAGDELLRRAAQVLRAATGEADKAQFFRVGGDELVAVVPKGRGAQVGEAAVKGFGVTPVGDVGVNSFLRYGVGETTEAADAAIRAAKKTQTETRYDRETKSTITTVGETKTPPDPEHPLPTEPSNAPETGPQTKVGDGPPEPPVIPPPRSLGPKPLPDTIGKDLGKYQGDLGDVKRNIRSLLNTAEPGSAHEKTLKEEFARIMDFEAKRDGGHSVTLQMHPAVAGGVGGFMAGFVYPTDDPEERLRNAVYFGALGVAGGVFANRRWGPGVPRTRPVLQPWEKQVAEKVLSYDDIKKPPVPFMMRLRQLYRGMVSRSAPVRAATAALGGENLPAQRNPGKLMQMFGRWQAQTESFLIDGPSLVDKDGNIQWLDALPAQKIMQMIDGDSDRLGLLMASARSLELAAKGVSTGVDALAARLTFIKAAPELHAAMAEMRKFNQALVTALDDAGLVADRDKMSDVFYAPLTRIFGGQVGGIAAQRTMTGKLKAALGVGSVAELKQAILNPAEATIDNTARGLRAAELNKICVSFADLLDATPDRELAARIGKFLHGNERKQIPGHAQKISELQAEMKALGTNLSQAEADKIVHTMSNEALNIDDDVIRFWRKGKIEQIRVNPEIAKAFRSLNPEEMGHLWKFLGLPTQFARLGIVNNPIFVARQAWRDNWQAWMNSEYGFIPFISQAKGWFAAVSRSKEYKEYLAAGGGYGSFAEQRFAKGQTALPDVQRAPVKNSIDQAAKEIREMKLLSAYQTLITPIVESARVGEYLRARGAGKSAIEAVYAAKQVTANYQDIGTSMRALGMMTLFLNPAIKSLEQAGHSFKRDPLAYLVKGFLGIALPSYYFWHTYQKDEELNQLRSTETGRKYWWHRQADGDIVKIPKPIFDGQIFGSTVETALDRQNLQDPESMKVTANALRQDIAVNLLPQLGVVPYSLFVNRDLSSGYPIVPESAEGLDPQYQFGAQTTGAARIIGKEIGVAPAQIDYSIRNVFGQLGINAVRAISLAVQYQETGYVPPKEELPFMDELFARYPSMNVGAIHEFYNGATKVDEVAKTLGHAAKYDAENVGSYIDAHTTEVGLIEVYKEARADLAELRQAVEDIRLAPQDAFSPQDKKLVMDELMKAMIEKAKAANYAARSVRASLDMPK